MTENIPTSGSTSSQVLLYANQAEAPTVIYATFVSRMAAWVIDSLILLGIRFAVLCVIGLVLVGIEEVGWETESVKTIGSWVILALLYLCAWPYYALMEASPRQATIGKRALNLQVHDIEIGRPTRMQTSIRFFFRIVSSLLLGCGFLWGLSVGGIRPCTTSLPTAWCWTFPAPWRIQLRSARSCAVFFSALSKS